MKKYILTEDTKLWCGVELRRIKAVRDIEGVCKVGALGGYVQGEHNLDQYGKAWVYGGAWETSPLYIQGTKYAGNQRLHRGRTERIHFVFQPCL